MKTVGLVDLKKEYEMDEYLSRYAYEVAKQHDLEVEMSLFLNTVTDLVTVLRRSFQEVLSSSDSFSFSMQLEDRIELLSTVQLLRESKENRSIRNMLDAVLMQVHNEFAQYAQHILKKPRMNQKGVQNILMAGLSFYENLMPTLINPLEYHVGEQQRPPVETI